MKKVNTIISSLLVIVVAISAVMAQMGTEPVIIYEDFDDLSVDDINGRLGGSARVVDIGGNYVLMFFDAHEVNRVGVIEIPIDIDIINNEEIFIQFMASFPAREGIFIYIVADSIIDRLNEHSPIEYMHTIIGRGYGIGFDTQNGTIRFMRSDGSNTYVDAELPYDIPIGAWVVVRIIIFHGRLTLRIYPGDTVTVNLGDIGLSRFSYLVIGGSVGPSSGLYDCMINDINIVVQSYPQSNTKSTTPTTTEAVATTQTVTTTIGLNEWWRGLSTTQKIVIAVAGLLILLILLIAAVRSGRRS